MKAKPPISLRSQSINRDDDDATAAAAASAAGADVVGTKRSSSI